MVSSSFVAPTVFGTCPTPSLRPSPGRCNAFAPPLRHTPSRSSPPRQGLIHVSEGDPVSRPLPNASPSPHATVGEPVPLLSRLEQVSTILVNPNTGKKVPWWKFWPETTPITTGVLELPLGPVTHLPVSTSRIAQAIVFGKKEVLSGDLQNTPIIVFAHGFSQRPLNYFSLLSYFALQQHVVIAPRTWILSVLFGKVETISRNSSLPAKLQTALLIDMARAVQVASAYSSCVHVLGHSMGGAMGLVYAGYAGSTLQSVALMAPEVGGATLTELNRTVRLDGDDGVQRMEKLASEMACRTMAIHGDRDRIVSVDDMQKWLSAFDAAPLAALQSLKRGTHVGFEDSLEVDLPLIDIEEFLFGIVDLLVFGSIFDIFGLDTKEQLKATKSILTQWIENVGRDEKELKRAIEDAQIGSESHCSWNRESFA